MKKLIVLLAASTFTAAFFYWRKREKSANEMWSAAREADSAWSKTAADQAHNADNAADTVAAAEDAT
jgi:hypothetical protein